MIRGLPPPSDLSKVLQRSELFFVLLTKQTPVLRGHYLRILRFAMAKATSCFLMGSIRLEGGTDFRETDLSAGGELCSAPGKGTSAKLPLHGDATRPRGRGPVSIKGEAKLCFLFSF